MTLRRTRRRRSSIVTCAAGAAALLHVPRVVTKVLPSGIDYYSPDGIGNNLVHPRWGSAAQPRIRSHPPLNGYVDNTSQPRTEADGLPSAHAVHLELFRNAVRSHPNKGTSQLLLYFGQFVAHDITRSEEDGNDEMPIPCSGGGGTMTGAAPHDHPRHVADPVGVGGTCSFACPGGGGGADATMPFYRMQRSAAVAAAGPDPDGQISQQKQEAAAGEEEEKAGGGGSSAPSATINFATSYLDLDMVYGSVIGGPPESDLRTYVGGKMKLDPQTGLPPFDTKTHGRFVTANPENRVNPSLLALHTVFLRYHNNRTDFHAERQEADLTDEELYWLARMDTTYAYQNIVEEKYVPTVLGTPLPQYKGYDPTVDPSVDVFFSTCAFRYGHSGLSALVRVLDPTFRPLPADPLLLRDVFEQTETILEDGATDGTTTAAAILRGMSAEPAKAVDGTFVDDVAYFTKRMAVANVQRGRDAGLPSYNDAREAFGLPRMESMNDLADSDERVAEALQGLYRSVDDVDAYVGALLEPHHVSSSSGGSSASTMGLGPLMSASVQEQFARLRDGDRFWYKARLTEEEIGALPSLSDMVKVTFGEEEMRYFPVDSFAVQLAVAMSEGGKGKQGMPLSDGASIVLLEEVAFTASWAFSQSQDKTMRYIDMTLSIGNLVHGGYISIGWGSQTMRGSEIWHCTAASVDDATPSPSCAIPSPGAADDMQGSSPTSTTADPLLFSCCVAPGLMHVAPRCASEAYPLDVVDSCLSPEASFVTFRVPLCKRREEEEEEEEVVTENKKCFRLPQGEVDFIAAFNPPGADGPHGFSRRTAGQLNLNSGWGVAAGSDSANGGLFALHGGVMIICWFVLVPAAIYIVRYCKGRPWRIAAHVTLVGITGSLVFAVATAAIVSVDGTSFGTVAGGSVFSDHKSVGLCVVAFVLFMLITGEARRSRVFNKKVIKTGWTDRAVLVAHRCGGFTLLGLGWWNCYTGLEKMRAYEADQMEITWLSTHTTTYDMRFFSIFQRYMYFPLITAICLIFLVATIRMRRSRGTEHIERVEAIRRGEGSFWCSEMGGQGLPAMSIDSFLDYTSQGSPFCIVDGFVIDISTFIDVHPGGSRMLRFAIGADISEHLIGQRDVDGIYHVHSAIALRTLRTLAKARLEVPEKDTLPCQRQGSSRESVKEKHQKRLSQRCVRNLVFRDAMIDMEYLTLEKKIEAKPVVRVRLALRKESADVLKETPLPSTTFVFRGRDSFGAIVERPYTPVKCYSSNAEVVVATDPMGLPTAFSTSFRSAATKKDLIYYEFLINLVPHGKMTSYLKNKKPGSQIMVQGPLANEAVLQKVDKDHQNFREIVLIAAGTGIAPMLQMIDYYCADIQSPGLTEPPKSVSGNDKPKVFLAWIIHCKSLSFEGAAQLKERIQRFRGHFRYFVLCHEIESSSRKLGQKDADALEKPVLFDALNKHFSAKMNWSGRQPIWKGSKSAAQSNTSFDDGSFQNEGRAAEDTDDKEKAPGDSSDSAAFLDRYRMKGHLDKELIARLLPLATGRDSVLPLNPSHGNDKEEYDDETRAQIRATYPNTLVAVCGRPAFDDQCVNALLELGFGEEQVVTFNRGNVPVSAIARLDEKIAARATHAPGPN